MLAGQVPIKTWPRDPRTARLVNTEFDHVVCSLSPPRRAPIVVSLSSHRCFHSTVSLCLSLSLSLSLSLARSLARKFLLPLSSLSPSSSPSPCFSFYDSLARRTPESSVGSSPPPVAREGTIESTTAPRELVARLRSAPSIVADPGRPIGSFGGDVLRNPSERTSSGNAH